MAKGPAGTIARWLLTAATLAVVFTTLHTYENSADRARHDERLYFPSGEFLVESSLGFREVMADWLWFRFIQYYGAYKNGENDLRYLDSLIDSVVRLDPKFTKAYYLASFIYWSDFGRFDDAYDILKRGILYNPDNAGLRFQIGFMHYVLDHDYTRAAHWFEMAGRCSDATDRETRFAAFARHKAGDDSVSLALWRDLLESTNSDQMRQLAEKMIDKLNRRVKFRAQFGDQFIGPIPEL